MPIIHYFLQAVESLTVQQLWHPAGNKCQVVVTLLLTVSTYTSTCTSQCVQIEGGTGMVIQDGLKAVDLLYRLQTG